MIMGLTIYCLFLMMYEISFFMIYEISFFMIYEIL
jgi:hypothetical protein